MLSCSHAVTCPLLSCHMSASHALILFAVMLVCSYAAMTSAAPARAQRARGASALLSHALMLPCLHVLMRSCQRLSSLSRLHAPPANEASGAFRLLEALILGANALRLPCSRALTLSHVRFFAVTCPLLMLSYSLPSCWHVLMRS